MPQISKQRQSSKGNRGELEEYRRGLEEAAVLLGISLRTLHRHLRLAGETPMVRFGRVVLSDGQLKRLARPRPKTAG